MNETEYYKNGPSEWNYKKLGDVVTFQGGSQPAKKYFSNDKSEGMIRLIQIRDYKNDNFITYVPKELCRRFCDVDDIMIGRYGPPIFQILRGIEGAYNVALIKAIPNEEIINKNYLYYFIKNEHLFKLIDGLSQRTSGQTGIDMDVLKKYIIPIPNLTEQEKIAEILSTVDEQIENTEKLIQKNQELKKGLMQQLLTKGIGHKEFKETELGEIPKEWEVKKIGEISDFCSNGFVGTATPYYSEKGTFYLMSNNVRENKIDTRNMIKVNDKFVSLYPRSKIYKDDMLTVQSGHIGTSCVVTQEYDNCNCHALIITRFKKRFVDSNFISYYLNSDKGKDRLSSIFVGSTIKHINVKDLVKFFVPVPEIYEQRKIVSILSSLDGKIEQYRNKKEKLEEMKKGLMQQLLKGKIRVV